MDLFLQIVTSFPTVIFTVILGVGLCLMLLTMLGMVDIEGLNFDIGSDGDGAGGVSALLMKLGLDGMPLMLIVLGVGLIGFVLSFLADYWFLREVEADNFRLLWMVLAVVIAFFLSLPLTGLLLFPLKSVFREQPVIDSVSLLGKLAIVRSPLVDAKQGMANLDDGGAGLILQVRSRDQTFERGQRVVLVEYIEASNAYWVIGEQSLDPTDH
ncbi:OB-fold-containig protein [Pseudomarimonas arenosa]|uniref:DUF1449 family protein n=1 Tax=Pseudomarimonas arenosa TaxID=2774145 RepID=A0AAW3ZMG4_9GAMM|nr:OB-fold-containig protein [Pseudomarimonas arenosa]MBD8526262.1 DUF1449 family protein [Pseudomarimonas arenosa]